MKSKIRKRLLALMLCIAMVVNGSGSVLADDGTLLADQETVSEEAVEIVEETTEEVVEEETIVDMALEESDEVVTEEVVDVVETDIVLTTIVNGTTITMAGPKTSFPQGSEYSVSATELTEEATQDVEASLRKVELETNEKIVSYKAYDIKLIVDGVEAQPTGDVKVTFQGAEVEEQVEAAEKVEVYHVDEEKQEATEVKGDVENNEVEMVTDHFSTYVITTTNQTGVTVTVQHYLTNGKTKLYRDSQQTLNVTERLEDISVAANYTVDKVVKMINATTEGNELTGSDVITANTIYRVYYSPTTGQYDGAVQMFDYHVDEDDPSKSINTKSNYGVEGKDSKYKITSGKTNQNHADNQYTVNIKVGNKTYNVNNYTNGKYVVPGIITGVDYVTGALEMGNGLVDDKSGKMYEPGFFTTEPKIGKTILEGYTLKFDRTGDSYTLNSVWNGTTKATNSGADFYPVDKINGKDAPSDPSNDAGHNHFFGLRYDIEFNIGDYVGPLNYYFSGDDDLWVVLDAKDDGGTVVVDIGGIHQECKGEVNIWTALGLNPDSMTEADRNKTHTLTILYMERGAGNSNCTMSFTLPNSKVINSAVNPTSFEFAKVNTSDEPLAGAQFGLYTGTTLTDTVTSDSNGIVKFNNLYPGTYTVKETKAPSGYVKNTTEYTLTVTKNGDNYSTSMTEVGKTVEVTKVTNYSQEEEAVKNITHNKTVSVLNENDRTYRINLTAATKGETQGTEAIGASIVLVLDASKSMTESPKSLQDIKDAANDFVTEINKITPESEIGIVWYKGHEGYVGDQSNKQIIDVTNFKILKDDINIIKSAINDGSVHDTSTGTPMGAALAAARTMLGQAKYTNKYVLFFTDGMPGHSSSEGFNCMVANRANNEAAKIKESAILYTVGYNLSGSFVWKEAHSDTSENKGDHDNWRGQYDHPTETSAENFLKDYIATKPAEGSNNNYAFTVNDKEELLVEFKKLAGEIGKPFEAQADQIIDVIDPRFDLVTTEAELKAAYGNGVSVSQTADGRTQIIWTGDSAKIRNEKDQKGPWNATFVVQAKSDFVGGNMIPTNGPESGIYIDSNVIKFPQPSVNVKLLQPSLDGKEITVYKGDKLDTTEFAGVLADSLEAIKLYDAYNEKFSVYESPVLTDEQVETLNSGTAVFVDYSYGNTNDIVGQFKFEYVPVVTPETEHLENVVGTPAEVYTLKVTFIANTVDTRETQLAGSKIVKPSETYLEGTEIPTGGSVVSSTEQATADYKVNVIAGQIVITKELTEPATRNVTFEFTVNMPTGQIVIPLTINQGETSATYDGSLLQNLSRGTYTISEVIVETHDLERTEIGSSTDSHSNVTDKVATIVLGNNLSGGNVISNEYEYTSGGVKGEVIFTNKEATADLDLIKITENGTKVNGAQFDLFKLVGDQWIKQGESSKVVDNNDSAIEFNDLVPGKYKLVEVVAPVGCAILATPIYFNISGGVITLVNEDGSAYAMTDDSMWTLENNVLTVENAVIYELPQSGGFGIYVYMIGGIMLMAFATFVLYKNRRKEVLAR